MLQKLEYVPEIHPIFKLVLLSKKYRAESSDEGQVHECEL
jgi:hypothetical protein